jgi:radical SAM protein with 4Fe4S-binding SPASM domain
VNLTGGEPLVRADWPRIAGRLADAGIDVVVITNGVLVDEEAVRRMCDAGVSGAAVSLDGDREVHDAIRVPASRLTGSVYDAALRAIGLLSASPLRTAVITQVHRRNLGQLEALHDLLASSGVDLWQIQIAMPLGRLLEYRERYLIAPSDLPFLEERVASFVERRRVTIRVADNIGYYGRREAVLRGAEAGGPGFWMGCMAGCQVVGVCSNGDVKGCPSHPKSFVVGNVRRTPFAAIWGDAARFSYNTEWREERLVGGCAKCAYRRVCRAGCTTMAFAVTGTIYDNPFCLQRAGGRP